MPFDIPATHAFIRCTAAVAILPNIQRKNHRDIDGTLGTSALRFEDIALCVAKPLESCVLVCCHTVFPNTYAEVILLRLCEINIFFLFIRIFMWRHSTSEISNGFAAHLSLYLKSAMPTSLRCHRCPYGSFAEFSGDRTRGSRRGLLNKLARYRWLTKKRISVAFESKRFSLPRAAKCEGLRETSALLPITCVKH